MSSSLWRHGDFLRLWTGQTVSLLGSRVTELALPLTALLVLHAQPAQLGLLTALEFAPVLVTTLLAGVWADGHRRRPVMFVSNAGRALILVAVPLVALAGALTMPILYAAALAVGMLTALFDVAYQAYLPSLIHRDDLVEGNAKLQASQSVAQVAGHGASGVLVQVLTAPGALLVDALSYVLAAVSIAAIRQPEHRVRAPGERERVADAVVNGLRLTFGHRLLRPIMLQSAWYNMLHAVVVVVMPVFAVQTLGLPPAVLGLVMAVGSVAALGGAVWARRLAETVGIGPAMAMGMTGACTGFFLLPFASGPPAVVISVLATGFGIYGAGLATFNVHSLSLRQLVTPPDVLGRVAASYRMVAFAAIPVGGVVGGATAQVLGDRATLFGTGVALVVSAVHFAGTASARVRNEEVQEMEPAVAAV
jgi:MFS family permease